MADVLGLLTAHYERARGKRTVIPEITDPATGEALVIYSDPVTPAEAAKVRREAGDNEADLTLWVVIYLAKDKDGNRVFGDDPATRKLLRTQVAGHILGRIAASIMDTSTAADLGNSSTPATTQD